MATSKRAVSPSSVRPSSRGRAPALASYDRPGLSEDEVEEIREAFNLFDSEGNGSIDPRELKQAVQSLGFEARNPVIFQIIAEIEKEHSGSIDFETFLDAISSKLGDSKSRSGIQKIFNMFDSEKRGSIGFKDLKRIARELNEPMSEEELREMVDRADSNGDGEISLDDFYMIMTKKTFA